MLDNITPIILTHNEAPNICRTLKKLCWAGDIVVVDSFSNDETLKIASGFPQVRVFQRRFDSHERQWNFALRETAVRTDWVLALDADYELTDSFVNELKRLAPSQATCGYSAKFDYCVSGKRLRSGIYPPVTVLYRRDRSSYCQDGHTQKVVIEGGIETLNSRILHDDRKPLSRWFHSQSDYTRLEAHKLLNQDGALLGWTDRVRRWRLVAPPIMLFYCLFVRGGVFDGRAGFFYAFQRALAELMLSLYLLANDLGFPTEGENSKQKDSTTEAPAEA
jgi:glycosyltransferase involved in cell wall biosynthesis